MLFLVYGLQMPDEPAVRFLRYPRPEVRQHIEMVTARLGCLATVAAGLSYTNRPNN